MHIYPKNTGPLRPEADRALPLADVLSTGSVQSIGTAPSSPDRKDRVQISDAGRALAARGETAQSAGLDPARAARIRQRVLSGAYDTLEVVDAVARRLLDSGDL